MAVHVPQASTAATGGQHHTSAHHCLAPSHTLAAAGGVRTTATQVAASSPL